MAPLGNFQQDDSGDSYAESVSRLPTPNSYEEAKKALIGDDALEEGTWGKIEESYAITQLEKLSDKRLSVKEANQKYPGMKNPFREPVSPYVADFLYQKEQERSKRDAILANGPTDTWSRVKLGTIGVGKAVIDPVDLAAMAAGGALVEGLAGAGKLGTTIYGVAADAKKVSASSRVGYEILKDAGAGLGMAAAQEGGKMAQASARGEDYKFEGGEFASNMAWGAGITATLGIAGEAFGKFLTRGSKVAEELAHERPGRILSRTLDEMTPEAKVAFMRDAVESVAEMRHPNTSRLLEAISRETSVSGMDFPEKFTYQREALGEVIPAGKKFYVAASSGSDFKNAKRFFPSDAMGDLTHATDHPGVANATALRQGGQIWEVTASADMKTFDLGVQFGAEGTVRSLSKEAQVFENALAKAGVEDAARLMTDGASAKDLVDMVVESGDQEALATLQDGMRELGYDALMHDGSTRNGFSHEEHNAMMFLNDEKLEPRGRMLPDEAVTNTPAPEDLVGGVDFADGDPGRLDFSKADIDQMYQKADKILMDQKAWVKDLADMNKLELENFELMDKQGLLGRDEKKLYEQLRTADLDAENERTAAKALLTCMMGAM